MNLTIDIGNSSVKIGCFTNGPEPDAFRRVAHDEWLAVAQSLRPAHAIVSSVTEDAATWASWLSGMAKTVLVLGHALPLPFANRYQTPRTLGTDRLAGVAGAQALFPGRSCLVVDAGTCLKFEWLENGSDYWGGSISPGLRMRFQAMHQFTSRLPLLEPAADAPLTGGSTAEAMQSGVLHGMTAEIEGMVAQYRTQHPGLRVLLTGGDAPFFEKRLFETRLKTPIFAVSELVATGLNHILNFNLQST